MLIWRLWHEAHDPILPHWGRVFGSGSSFFLKIATILILIFGVLHMLGALTTMFFTLIYLSLFLFLTQGGMIMIGAYVAWRVCRLIERGQTELWTLLVILPQGKAQALWMLFVHIAQMEIRLRKLPILRRMLLAALLVPPLLSVGSYLLFAIVYVLPIMLALWVLIYLESVFAVITGGVIGMLAASFEIRGAAVVAAVSTVLLRMLCYVLLFFSLQRLNLLIVRLPRIDPFFESVLMLLSWLGLLALFSECVVRLFWWILRRRVDEVSPLAARWWRGRLFN